MNIPRSTTELTANLAAATETHMRHCRAYRHPIDRANEERAKKEKICICEPPCVCSLLPDPNANVLGDLFKKCRIEEMERPKLDEYGFEDIPCLQKVKLRAEDEISVSSIISHIISKVEPSEEEWINCQDFGLTTADMDNPKKSMLFTELLYISSLKGTNCKLDEEEKIFRQSELKEIGQCELNIEESYDGYVVYNKCKMRTGKHNFTSGHSLVGKYTDKFILVCEKRMEFDYLDSARIEKTLEARNKDDKVLIAIRSTKVNEEMQKFKAVIDINGRDEVFLMDGGVMLLMRWLIITNYRKDYSYYSMNLFGKIIKCVLSFGKERKTVRIFNRTFTNAIVVRNTQYFDDEIKEVSETYFQSNGNIVLHYWQGFNFVLHSVREPPSESAEYVVPKMELMWKSDNALKLKYKEEKELNFKLAMDYMNEHPELADFLHDYLINLLKYKPSNVLEFSVQFFQNMRTAV